MGEGVFEGGALEIGESEAGFFLGPFDGGVGFDRRESAGGAGEADDDGGDFFFGAVVVGELDEAGAGERTRHAGGLMADEGFVGNEGGDTGFEETGIRFEERGGVVDEVGFAVGGVAVFLEGLEGVEEAGVEAGRGVVGEAEVNGDAIGGFEADTVDLAGDFVGLFEENGFGLCAVVLNQLHALAGGDAIRLEEDVEFALGAFFVPGGLDRGGAFFADARDVAEFAGFFGKDAEGVGAESVDDFVGVGFADAGDEAAAEIFADAVDGGRELAREGGDLELGAVLSVVRPLAGELERLAAFDAGEGADDGDEVGAGFCGGRGSGSGLAADGERGRGGWAGGGRGGGRESGFFVGAEFRDGVVVLLVEENNAFEDAGERGGGCVGGGVGHGEKCAESQGDCQSSTWRPGTRENSLAL